MYGFTLILTLAVIGGVIAFFGDKIGMKVGRKRLTLFGLRPKHTSIIITILTGVFISGSAITVLSIVSEDVRTALFNMKAIQEALSESQQQLESSLERVRSIEIERDIAEMDLLQATQKLADATKQYEQVIKDLENAKLEVEENERRLNDAKEFIEALNIQIQDLQGQQAKLQDSILELETEIKLLEDQHDRQLRQGNFIFFSHEIISAQVFQGGKARDTIYHELLEFLSKADQYAALLGAGRGVDSPAISVLDVALYEAIEILHQHEGLYVVRVVSKNNALAGETVATYLELIPNELLFEKGAVLREYVYDPSIGLETDDMLLSLISLANTLAVERGMITTEGDKAVQVPLETFLEAMTTLNEAEERCTIRIVAAEDTWAAIGPMYLTIEIEPL
ncbi:MAG: DUF3084 domain-containing protein [Firmicutes bacterium]|nr:DUF3084 domain-containing protein [Bacillota bacterium]